MARKRKKPATQGQRLAALRQRANTELKNLAAAEAEAGKGSARGRALQHQQSKIRDVMRGTYLNSSRPSQDVRRSADRAANELSQLIGRKGARGRKAAQERANRVTWQQVAVERRGGKSALYGGDLARSSGEQIFWASTRDIWMGTDPSKRLQTVMAALGVSSLEDAIKMVLEENADAVDAARAAYDAANIDTEENAPDKLGTEIRGSDIWIAFTVSYYLDKDKQLQIARR